ncbi:hypothetical protein [Enemella sp. A6]|uniref:hypothetical protein n=1 Tax=Enemella sp. A6 TaxID=3440152 RepID=UPI003EBFB250
MFPRRAVRATLCGVDHIEEGFAFAKEAGFGDLAERGTAIAEELGNDLVYAGFSFGVMTAQRLAQTRPQAAALLMERIKERLLQTA